MRLYLPPPTLFKPALLSSLVLCMASVHAQDAEFADDFSSNSIAYTSGSFDDSDPDVGERVVPGAIVLELGGANFANRLLQIDGAFDGEFSATFSFDSSTTLGSAEDIAFFGLSASVFNTEQDGGDGESRNGDVEIDYRVNVNGIGQSLSTVCVGRTNGDDFEDLNVFADGTDFCQDFSTPVVIGTTYEIGVSLNTDNNSLVFTLDDEEIVGTVSSNIFAPARSNQRVRLQREAGSEFVAANVTSITANGATDDFSGNTPVVNRYERPANDRGRTTTWTGDRVRLSVVSNEDGSGNGVSLSPAVRTDYLEALVTLSSESVVANERQRAQVGMETIFFNDTADGSGDDEDRTGDVRAQIFLITEANGRRQAEYCLERSNDADFDDRTPLLADNNGCFNFPMVVEFDTPYRMSIELDRDISAVTYRLDGFSETVMINTPIFQPARSRQEVEASARDQGSAVVYVDDVRTSPEALTASEVATGATVPTEFPQAPDLDALQVDSTLSAPFDFDFTETTLDWIDDFSGPSSQFGFWSGDAGNNDRGESGVQFVNGAIEMQTNSAEGNDDGSFTEFYIDGDTDSLKAGVSLSSSSRLPPDPDAEAQISIRATFLNDTQDGGFDGREGDIESGITLRLRGDGRREIFIDLRRRNADGSSENLRPFDLVELDPVNDLIPTLDTIYELGVAVDRERQVLLFSVDETTVEYQLSSQAFLPAEDRKIISTNHRGSSGVAIASLHSVTTDVIDQDFSLDPPFLAPYRPAFSGQQLGQSVEVVDGRLRLEADSTQSSSRGPSMVAHGLSDHVSATIELSSESAVLSDGVGFVRVFGQFYNDTADGGTGAGTMGDVFSVLALEDRGDGELFVATCAFRNNNEDFSDVSELIGGDTTNCPRMATVPMLDTPYQASITIDRENATMTYRFADESFVYNLGTGAFLPAGTFQGVSARSTDGSKIIAFADDLAFDENPVPLEASSNLLIDGSGDAGTGDGTTDGTDEDTGTGEPVSGGNDSTGGSSGGGGCSIAGDSGNELPLIATLAAGILFVRRRFSVATRR